MDNPGYSGRTYNNTFWKRKWIGIVLIFVILFPTESFGAKIMFLIPIASRSQKNVFDPYINALASRGHEVTVVTSVKSKTSESSQNIRELIPVPVDEYLEKFPNYFEERRNGKQSVKIWPIGYIIETCHKVFSNKEFQELQKEDFDLIIVRGFGSSCFDGLLYKWKAPFIIFTTWAAPSVITELVGNHMPASFVPFFLVSYSDDMTFFERFHNTLYVWGSKIVFDYNYGPQYEAVYRQYLGHDVPDWYDIEKNVSLILMNSFPAITYPRPLMPNVIEVGGMQCREPRPLPADLQRFMDEAKDGVIYFSLGSIVKEQNMPKNIRQIFVNVFRSLKQRVIWKWDGREEEDIPSNVLTSNWLPQQDILGHPNLKLFITHGGLLSTTEAVCHGVPLLGIPLFGDQDVNMKQAEHAGYAKTLEISELTESHLQSRISVFTSAKDNPFALKARQLSSIFRDQKETPVERAVFWTEYVIRHKGAEHLRSPARNLNYFQHNSWDVIFFLASIVVVIFVIVVRLFVVCIRCLKRSVHSVPENRAVRKLQSKKSK